MVLLEAHVAEADKPDGLFSFGRLRILGSDQFLIVVSVEVERI